MICLFVDKFNSERAVRTKCNYRVRVTSLKETVLKLKIS